jgi:hypothetical protein
MAPMPTSIWLVNMKERLIGPSIARRMASAKASSWPARQPGSPRFVASGSTPKGGTSVSVHAGFPHRSHVYVASTGGHASRSPA